MTAHKSMGDYLDEALAEGVKSALAQRALREKEKQAALSPDKPEHGEEKTEVAPSKTMSDETDKLKTGNIKTDDIVSKMNAIRSGRSFKDEKIFAALDQYVNSLSRAEKTALLAFLKGIAQIVTGEISGAEAVEPEKSPADVTMKKDEKPEQQSKHVEPNVIKIHAPKLKTKIGAEDTTPPVPIIPKRK